MKEKIFNNKSRIGKYFFRKMLGWLESDTRLHFNDPRLLVQASGVKPGQQVIEAGCGSGFFTPAISEAVGKHGFIESIDLHPAAVEHTRKKMKELSINNVQVSIGDAHCSDFSSEYFDVAIVYGVIPAPVISEADLGKEMERLLKPEGILAVWTLAPFWRPSSILKNSSLKYCGKTAGVHLLQKPAA